MSSLFEQMAVLEDLIFEESLRDSVAKRKESDAASFEHDVVAPAREALRAAEEAAGEAPAGASFSVRATARYNLGVALCAEGWVGESAEELRAGAAELRQARDDYKACEDNVGLLKALINLGVVRFREGKLLREGELLQKGHDSFEAAAALCTDIGEALWLAKARYNQGLVVEFVAQSNPDSEWFGGVADIFEQAREKFAEAGDTTGAFRARVKHAACLGWKAAITRNEDDLREALESAATASELATEAGDPYRSGMARAHHFTLLCARAERAKERCEADVEAALRLADAAAQNFREAGSSYLHDEVEKAKRYLLEGLVPAGKFDKPDDSVPSRRDDTEQQEGRIADDPAAVATTIDVGADFAGAVGALKSRLVPTVTDHDIAELEALIHEAQRNLPADKEGFVRDVRRMLAAGGLQLTIAGVDASVQLGMKNRSIQLMVSRQGSRSFRAADLHVEKLAPEVWTPEAERQPS